MSTFVKLIVGAAKSNTVQFNSIMVAIWAALAQMEFIQSNPDYLAVLGGIQAIVNIFLRAKTDKPLTQR